LIFIFQPEEIIKNLTTIKSLLTGDGEEPNAANCLAFANDVVGTGFLKTLTKSIALIPPDV
jgi:hypothetical protein